MQWRKNSYSRPRNVVTRITKWYELSTKQNLHSCACYCSIQDTWSEVLFALEPLLRGLKIFILHVVFWFWFLIDSLFFPLCVDFHHLLWRRANTRNYHTLLSCFSVVIQFSLPGLFFAVKISWQKTSKHKVLNKVFSFNSAVNRSRQCRQARSSSVSLHIMAWSLGSPGHHCFLNVPSQVKDNSGCWPWACSHSLQVSGRNRHR